MDSNSQGNKLKIEHANRLFEYIKYLNKIENDRSITIIMVNGLLITFLGLFTRDVELLPLYQMIILISAFVFSALSLGVSVRIFQPKTDDELSPMHHTGIRTHDSWGAFSEVSLSMTNKDIIEQICRETWVVARIVKWRGIQVKWSAIYFGVSLVLSIILLISYIISAM